MFNVRALDQSAQAEQDTLILYSHSLLGVYLLTPLYTKHYAFQDRRAPAAVPPHVLDACGYRD